MYRTDARKAESHAVGHLSRTELMRLLRGKGQGRARWPSAYEVMQARRYVEQWAEHLLDFGDIDAVRVGKAVAELYKR